MADGTPTEVSVANLSALQLVQAARAVQTDEAAGLSFGPQATELAAIEPDLVTATSDGPAVNIANTAGLAWAAAAEAGDRVAALETRVRELERQLAEFL